MVKIKDLVTDEDRKRWKEEGLNEERELSAQRSRETIRGVTEFRFGFVPRELDAALDESTDSDALALLVQYAAYRAQSPEELLERAEELLG